ncbi:MAG: ABC transporter permease, partial [Pseudomonadota bacterium]
MSVSTAIPVGARGFAGARFAGLFWSFIGLAVLLLAWWLGGQIIQADPDLFVFAEFAPKPTLRALYAIVANGEAWTMILPSLWRVGAGLGFAAVIGVPVGIAI